MSQINYHSIDKFLNGRFTFPIFARPYSQGMVLACYLAYSDYLSKELGCKVKDVLVHKRSDDQFEFYVGFGSFSNDLVERLNMDNGLKLIRGKIRKYHQKIARFKAHAQHGTPEQLFWLGTKILAFEAHSFIIPYIEHDLSMHFNHQEIVELCAQARLDTERFFEPGGELDTALAKKPYLPSVLSGHRNEAEEYLIYQHKFIYEPDLIAYFKAKTEVSKSRTIKGNPASPGLVKGRVKVLLSSKEMGKFNAGDILVASGTTPDYMPAILKASAIISDEGGFLCHASIVSRELQIPCLVGAKVATKTLKDGDLVEVDANKGIISLLE